MMHRPDAILEAARQRSTGTRPGEVEGWQPGLEAAVAGIGEVTAPASPERKRLLDLLTDYLAKRIDIVTWGEREPEILEEDLGAPLFVVGMPRTGTTATLMLLAEDEANRPLRYWEGRSPTPPPGLDPTDAQSRRVEAQEHLDGVDQVFPGIRSFHPYLGDADGPVESYDFMGMCFASFHLLGLIGSSSYERWIRSAPFEPVYRFVARALRLLQWRTAPGRWVLKNPQDLLALEDIAQVFAGARFLWIHRPLEEAVHSNCEMEAVTGSRRVGEIGRLVVDRWEAVTDRALTLRRRLGEERFHDVWQPDLRTDAVGTMASVYDWLGWNMTPALERRIDHWASTRRPARVAEYELRDFGLPESLDRFAAYRQLLDRVSSR